ncbi:uncharacterized protein LOC118766528 [Octopus sinensis]|uniref:Uncharacterized protein LOC118766528 n=1 Tax=Octopus sinensis TaxID=2607531 RepID=A0A7E6FE44_9MOLL|nr:uncharacterized protein LOC118766528 [Octopus sinensis]
MCHVIGQKGNGTGISISHDTILTCSHVVCDNSEVSIKLHGDKHWHQATLVYSAPLTEPFDVAVLKLNNCSSLTPTKSVSFTEITMAVEELLKHGISHLHQLLAIRTLHPSKISCFLKFAMLLLTCLFALPSL